MLEGATMIINNKELEYNIRYIEKFWKKQELDIEERSLIIRNLNGRINKILEGKKASDMLGQMPLGGIIKRFQKQAEGGEE